MSAYYNEHDPFAADWLRNLIAAGHIARGDVDERSIVDVRPVDLAGYTQCHFFAGIGIWSLALRNAGWTDDRPVWTGSCPCQPFSAAGKRGGASDERHLWPAFFHLIRERRPAIVLGEQVASKDGLGWLDLVSADLEGEGYAFGAADMCAAGLGAPHIRQRLWFVGMADARLPKSSPGREASDLDSRKAGHGPNGSGGDEPSSRSSFVVGLGNTDDARPQERRDGPDQLNGPKGRKDPQRSSGLSSMAGGLADESGHQYGCRGDCGLSAHCCGGSCCALPNECDGNACRLADADGGNAGAEGLQRGGQHGQRAQDAGAGDGLEHANSTDAAQERTGADVVRGEREAFRRGAEQLAGAGTGSRNGGGTYPAGVVGSVAKTDAGTDRDHRVPLPGPLHGVWGDADWLLCRDDKWRPVEPGTFPLAHGIAGRVGRLRAYGNGLAEPVARAFIEAAVMDAAP